MIVIIGNKRFKCPELLFNSNLNKIDSDDIHQALFDIIKKYYSNGQKDLYIRNHS
jgi:hypothetical protein